MSFLLKSSYQNEDQFLHSQAGAERDFLLVQHFVDLTQVFPTEPDMLDCFTPHFEQTINRICSKALDIDSDSSSKTPSIGSILCLMNQVCSVLA